MIGFQSLLLLFFCITWCYQSNAQVVDYKVDLIADTCKKTSHFDLCVKTLRANPKSLGSDVNGLASIILEEELSYSNTTLNQINDLIKKTSDKITKDCLNICASLYVTTASNILDAIELLKVRSGPAYRSAVACTDAVSELTTFCEDNFKDEPKRDSPLTARNAFLDLLATVASEIVRSIIENLP